MAGPCLVLCSSVMCGMKPGKKSSLSLVLSCPSASGRFESCCEPGCCLGAEHSHFSPDFSCCSKGTSRMPWWAELWARTQGPSSLQPHNLAALDVSFAAPCLSFPLCETEVN